MRLSLQVLALCALLKGVSAFRARARARARASKKFKNQEEASFIFRRRRTIVCPEPTPGNSSWGVWGQPGEIDYLYTFGAPGCASPGLQHWTNADGVFPGMRSWTRNIIGVVDICASITSTVWLWHPMMDAESIRIGGEPVLYLSSLETTKQPSQLTNSVLLHMPWEYWYATDTRKKWGCNDWQNYSMFSNNISYVPDPGHAARFTAMYGWGLVGSAYYDGVGSLIGGPQASHLLQHPDTLECVLTFQGTQDYRDWFANLAIRPTHFCGLVEPDEECSVFGLDTCKVRRERGAFVHWGFADTIRRMTRVPDFQTKIHKNLQNCKAVYATGHSLGGAIASLFTACVSRQLKLGEYGYEEDYKYMGWAKALRPKQMPTIQALPDPNGSQ